MSDPFIGEIKMFGGSFAPKNWAFCDGQTIAIASNDALFSLIGTTYGGDGRSTFALPDMRGRLPMNQGQGPGLTSYPIGARVGYETVPLQETQIPAHKHVMQGSTATAGGDSPAGAVLASPASTAKFYDQQSTTQQYKADAVKSAGNGQAHSNIMPYSCVNFIICLIGTYPSRN